MNSTAYKAAFHILSDDFHRLTEFIEPTDDNLKVYSHRLYELLLRACTEFESVAKERLVENGYQTKPSDMDINDYKTLEQPLQLEPLEVGVLLWRPAVAYVRPFAGWSSATPPLSWYRSYNQVKHNRNTQFALANLENVRLAMAGLFALLAKMDIITSNQFGFQQRAVVQGYQENIYPNELFSLNLPV